jgi:hypothetical protein
MIHTKGLRDGREHFPLALHDLDSCGHIVMVMYIE